MDGPINDLISVCLSMTPVPGLHFAFTTLTWIINTAKQVQDSKEQIGTLTMALAQLMKTINDQYRRGKLIERETREALTALESLLDDVRKFVEAQAKNSVFSQIITYNKRLSTIDTFHRRLTMSINAFQVAALVDTQHLLSLNEQARKRDQQQLYQMLRDLESNQRRLIDALDLDKNEPAAMMAALQRRIGEGGGDAGQDNLSRFYTTSLRYLTTTSGKKADLTPWTITSFDVEIGHQIGAGGFGTVYRGKWNEMDVAIKVMRSTGDAIPRAVTVRREVDAWSRLRHPHILQFLGANILDTTPFIVTPYLKQGNVAEYLLQNPDCNRLEIIHHICLGLTYLHTQRVVHGDIKGTNVLIDDSGKGVLCDFGLARIKADVNSRSALTKLEPRDTQMGTMGSQNWMAPELFEGSSLRMPCDIYSLGMTIYEIFTGEVPLSHIHPVRFQDAVINNTRPQKPDNYDAPQLTGPIWAIATACWTKNPAGRPSADSLCRDIKFILDAPPMPVVDTSASRQVKPVTQLPKLSAPASSPTASSRSAPLARNAPGAQRANTAPVLPMSPITAHPNGRIRIVDSSLPTQRPYKRCLILKKPNSNINCAALSPNGKVILTGHFDGTLRTWDALKGVLKRDYLLGSNKIVTKMSFSPTTSTRYAAASKDQNKNTTSVYVVLKDKSLVMLNPEVSDISSLTILSDETIVGVEYLNDEVLLMVWKRLKTGRTPSWDTGVKLSLLGLDSLPEPLAGCGFVVSPEGKTIWTGNTSHSIFTSTVETGQQEERPLHIGSEELTSGPIHSEPTPWHTADSTIVPDPKSSTPTLVHLACAPDGKKLAISYATGEILVLDLRSKKVKTMREAASGPNLYPSLQATRAPPVVFSGDGSRVIYPCNVLQKTIKIQDIATNVILDSVYLTDCPPNNDISFISVTPNFKHITVSFVHGTHALVYIWA